MLDRIQRILNLESLRATTTNVDSLRAGSDTQSEQSLTEASAIIEVGGSIVRSLDYSKNPNDPEVNIAGYGPWKLSYLKKDIQNDLNRVAEMVGTRPASQLLQILSDVEGKKSSNLYVAFKMAALAEVEEFLERPSTKRRVTQMKKTK